MGAEQGEDLLERFHIRFVDFLKDVADLEPGFLGFAAGRNALNLYSIGRIFAAEIQWRKLPSAASARPGRIRTAAQRGCDFELLLAALDRQRQFVADLVRAKEFGQFLIFADRLFVRRLDDVADF